MMRILVTAFASLLVALSDLQADDWRQFRGNDSSGVSHAAPPPTKLDAPEMVAWKIDLPGRGVSGPIVVGDRVLITASSGYRDDRLHILCFSASNGEKLWQRNFNATGRTICHETICMATPQPCSDGTKVYAYFSSNDVAGLDLDGNLLWYRALGLDYPNASSSLGMSSSPVVADDTVILQLESVSEALVTGLDALTGETRWKLDRDRAAVFASPAIYHAATDAPPQVILQSPAKLLAVEPRTGKTCWELPKSCSTTASTSVVGEYLLAPTGGLSLLRPLAGGGTPERMWDEGKLSPDMATPIAYKDKVYVVKNSILTCADLATGKSVWQLRLDCKSSYASPLATGDHLYVIDENGVLLTIDLTGKKGKTISRLELGQPVWGTPAIANGAIYLRSDKYLWKFASAN